MFENLITWFEIQTADYLREWQICSFSVQGALLLIAFAYFFKKGIGFKENLNLRSFYYRLSIYFVILGWSIFNYIISVYYIQDIQLSYMMKTLSIGVGLIGTTLLFRNLEKLKIMSTNKILPRVSAVFTAVIFILIFLPSNPITPIIALIDWLILPFSLFLCISYKTKGRIRLQSLFLTFGFAFFFSGLIVIPDIIESLIPNIRFLPGSALYIYYNYVSFMMVYCGLIMIIVFGRINYFIEIKWGEKINSLLILMKNGEFILYREFNTAEKKPMAIEEGKELIQQFSKRLKEMDNPPKIMEKGGNTLFFKEGIYVLALLVTDEYMKFFETKFKEFLRDFELLYYDFLMNWDADLKVFESTYALIDRHFQTGGI
ncbi:MAG: hypothetical protein ACTSRG_01430 [Candidatus Helarchaeota archaeon]